MGLYLLRVGVTKIMHHFCLMIWKNHELAAVDNKIIEIKAEIVAG